MDLDELSGSELGTQEFWETRYKSEIKNFRSHGDVGDVWFGENAGDRVCRWLKGNSQISLQDKIVDIGCGNGVMLIDLAQENFTELYGIDYSETGVLLAKEIAAKHKYPISYKVCNILDENNDMDEKFLVALDKGTFDAISLHPIDCTVKKTIYVEHVARLLRPNGFLIITSCNWTQEELLVQFKNHFKFCDLIPTPQFVFGGKVGNIVTSIVLQKI